MSVFLKTRLYVLWHRGKLRWRKGIQPNCLGFITADRRAGRYWVSVLGWWDSLMPHLHTNVPDPPLWLSQDVLNSTFSFFRIMPGNNTGNSDLWLCTTLLWRKSFREAFFGTHVCAMGWSSLQPSYEILTRTCQILKALWLTKVSHSVHFSPLPEITKTLESRRHYAAPWRTISEVKRKCTVQTIYAMGHGSGPLSGFLT